MTSSRVYDVTQARGRARRGRGAASRSSSCWTYRRKGHAEHDDQSYVPDGEIERWATENDPLDRYVRVLIDREKAEQGELDAIDERVRREIDSAVDVAARPRRRQEGPDALEGVYADPPQRRTAVVSRRWRLAAHTRR